MRATQARQSLNAVETGDAGKARVDVDDRRRIRIYSQAGRVSELIAALERRSEASANVEGKRADRELVAALYEERIQNLNNP